MDTTFQVLFLGQLELIDPVEGNLRAENADAILGEYGGVNDPLLNKIATLSAISGNRGFAGGGGNDNNGGGRFRDVYNQSNNARSERFRIDNGAEQVFDAVAVYNATITYTDGSDPVEISAVVFQDVAGNTYLAPELERNADQDALEAKPIRSLELRSVRQDSFTGLAGEREAGNFLTCYVAGTLIRTATGTCAIEHLRVGDLVMTKDHGPRPIRWIGHNTVQGLGKLAPIQISAGALGADIPARDLWVSRQHRMMISSKICQRMFGSDDLLVAAIKLTALPGIDIVETEDDVTYYHLMTDDHDVIFAEGAPSETLLTGEMALAALGPDYVAEIEAIFPSATTTPPAPARLIASGKKLGQLIARHEKNNMALAC